MSRVETASDVLVSLGVVVVIAGLAVVWWPLGILTFGLALIGLGFVFFLKANGVRRSRDNS